MRLGKEQLTTYGPEISELYDIWLHERPVNGLAYFGAFDKKTLTAVGAVRCYMGNWYLRAFVVKPEYRGRGLFRALMNECLDYLSDKTDVARISVFPDNFYSIRNIEAVGFKLERRKKLEDGKSVLVYKISLPRNGISSRNAS